MRLFLLSMTIGYLHVGVILLKTRISRILWTPDYVKRSTDWAKSRPDGGILLGESRVQVTSRARDMKSIVSLRVLKVRNPMNRM